VEPFKHKVVVHVSCTGFGGKAVELGVQPAAWTRERYDLLAGIVGAERTVLRVDPIIPTAKGVATAEGVLRLFEDSAVQRVRWSLMDMYRHVADRFSQADLPHPYQGRFSPSTEDRIRAQEMLARWTHRYRLESCAESGGFGLGCISGRDTDAVGLDEAILQGSAGQRKECLCPGNKTELLSKPKRCGHQCLYCYWKD